MVCALSHGHTVTLSTSRRVPTSTPHAATMRVGVQVRVAPRAARHTRAAMPHAHACSVALTSAARGRGPARRLPYCNATAMREHHRIRARTYRPRTMAYPRRRAGPISLAASRPVRRCIAQVGTPATAPSPPSYPGRGRLRACAARPRCRGLPLRAPTNELGVLTFSVCAYRLNQGYITTYQRKLAH